MIIKCKFYLILLMLTTFLFGQPLKGIGFKSGLVTSNQNWEISESDMNIYDENFYGFYFGISYDLMEFSYFSSNFEIAYTQKGMAEEFYTNEVNPDEQLYIDTKTKTLRDRIDNISLAIYGNLKFETNFLTPYFLIGPRLDIQINRHLEIGALSSEFKKYIYGFSFGGGILIHTFSKHDLVLEITSSPNINKLYKTESLKVSNYSYEVKLGIKLK